MFDSGVILFLPRYSRVERAFKGFEILLTDSKFWKFSPSPHHLHKKNLTIDHADQCVFFSIKCARPSKVYTFEFLEDSKFFRLWDFQPTLVLKKKTLILDKFDETQCKLPCLLPSGLNLIISKHFSFFRG